MGGPEEFPRWQSQCQAWMDISLPPNQRHLKTHGLLPLHLVAHHNQVRYYTHFHCRTQRNQADELGNPLPLVSVHSTGRCYAGSWRRHTSLVVLKDPMNYNIDLPATFSVLMPQWCDSYGNNQLLSDWIQGLLHFMSGFVNLSKGHDLGYIRI